VLVEAPGGTTFSATLRFGIEEALRPAEGIQADLHSVATDRARPAIPAAPSFRYPGRWHINQIVSANALETRSIAR